MLVGAAICPSSPLLVPELGTGGGPELDRIRDACQRAVRALGDSGPDQVICVAPERAFGTWGPGARGSLRAYGVDVRAGLPVAGSGRPAAELGPSPELPPALTIGAWLLDRADDRNPRRYVGVPHAWKPQRCLALGRQLARSTARIGLLVVGDGSARRGPRAPGREHPQAAQYDTRVAQAMAPARPEVLAGLAGRTARELMAAGRPTWQVLAGAAGSHSAPIWQGRLIRHTAPYGVGYLVACWSRAELDDTDDTDNPRTTRAEPSEPARPV